VTRFGANANRPYDVADVLDRLDADVLVLPETFLPHGHEGVMGQLPERGYTVEYDRWVTLAVRGPRPRHIVPGDGWWCLAVASRFPVLQRVDIPLPHTLFDPARPRVAIHLTLDVRGTAVDVVGLHTSSRLWWGAPVIHLSGLRRELPPFPGAALLAGDFNLWGPGVELLLPGWHRTVRGRTYPAHRPHSQIDHVLVNDRVTCLEAAVIDDERSDHRPVLVRLSC
jgi:endonuclease/exonuclease/phosphatase family metal-dependent hydrolase